MKALGVVVDKVELKKMITDVDADGSGSVEFPEFLQMMTAKMGSSDSKEDVVKVFKMFDEAGSGKIDFKALRKVAKELGENLSDDELQARACTRWLYARDAWSVHALASCVGFTTVGHSPLHRSLTSVITVLTLPRVWSQSMLEHADKSNLGYVNMDDFYRLMKKKSNNTIDDLLGDD